MRLPSFDFSATAETLQNRNFAIFTAGNGVALIGTWAQRLAVGWLTWHLTESGTWLGAVAMAEFAPVLFLAPVIGVLTDRYDRRRIAVIGQVFASIQAIVLAVLTLTGVITPVLVLALQLCSGVVQPLIQTARLVLVPMLLPPNRVGNGVAITSLMFNTARIIGPMIAGLLISAVGVGWAFALNAVTYVGVIVAVLALKLPPHQHVRRPGQHVLSGVGGEISAGWRYVAKHPLLSWVIPTVGIASTLTWPIGDLMPGIADHVFARGAAGLATLTSAQGVGAILGGLFLAQRPSPDGLARIVITAMAINGTLVAVFAVTKIFWLAVPVILVSSFFSVMVGVGSQALAQTAVSDQMRGRTLSVWYTVTRVGPALGALILGSLSSTFGFSRPLFAAGLVSAAAAAATLWFRRPGQRTGD